MIWDELETWLLHKKSLSKLHGVLDDIDSMTDFMGRSIVWYDGCTVRRTRGNVARSGDCPYLEDSILYNLRREWLTTDRTFHFRSVTHASLISPSPLLCSRNGVESVQ